MGKFKELRVWNDGMDLTAEVYRLTHMPGFSKDYAFIHQIRKAALSIPSNIAEGDERGTNRESVYFFNVAKGSAAEVITQLNVAARIGYLNESELNRLEDLAEKIRASLKNLIAARGGRNPLHLLLWLFISLPKPL